MPHYVVSSEAPIRVKAVERPDLPGWKPEHPWVPGEGGGEYPDTGGPGGFPGFPERPGRPIYPVPPSRDDLIDMLPPGLKPGVGLPFPPTPEHPWVPVDPDPEHPEVWPPPGVVWPPLRPERPGMPDMTGKTLMAAAVYVSGFHRPPTWGYIVVDHDAAKGFVEKVMDWIRSKLPAGGVGGRPPPRPPGT
jgi:hypothetical protein